MKQKLFNNVEDYFNKIDVYSKILKNNYMFHTELFNEFRIFLNNNYKNKIFNLLDLGCGNGFFMSQVLENSNIEFYKGYDLSQDSLIEAEKNMSKINCKKIFINADISKDFTINEIEIFNLIWASYSLHHLQLDEKKKFLKNCLKILKKNSHLIIVDFINNYKSKDEWFENYKIYVERNWINLTSEDKTYLYDHVFNFDFPETLTWFENIAKEIGFKKFEVSFQKDCWAYMLFSS